MLRHTAAAAQLTHTIVFMKLFEVYRMQYDSPALSGTSVLSASHKNRVMRPVALA